MKLARSLFVLALAAAAAPLAGCAKSSDTGHLEHEATALVNMYARKLGDLEEYRRGLEARAKALAGLDQGGGGKIASDFRAASARLAELRQRAERAPAELTALAKGSAARTSLITKIGDFKRDTKDGINIVQSAFATYDAHLTNVEVGRATVVANAPGGNITPAPPSTPASTSPTTPSGDLPPTSTTQGGPAQRAPAGGN